MKSLSVNVLAQQETSSAVNADKVYTYDEAIDTTGNGLYNISIVAVMSVAALSMGCDMFGFSVVVTGATCDFDLSIDQTSLLLSASFLGPIFMSYPWGYMSDTRGRRRSLLIALWGSCIVSSVSAFSPNWIVLGILKLISTSFISCVQSSVFTIIGESCSQGARDRYMIVVAAIYQWILGLYIGIAYLVLNSEYSYDLGLIDFTPWRLLILVLASITFVAAIGTLFLYESPKYLLNAGRDEQAVNILSKIYEKNGGARGSYPVKKIILNEVGNKARDTTIPLCRSLWRQLVPLFKPPLLWRSMQVYFLAFIVYGTNNSYYVWFPYMAQRFFETTGSDDGHKPGLCHMISEHRPESTECSTKVESSLVWATLGIGAIFSIGLCCFARIAHRKRAIMMGILLLSSVCGFASVLVPHNGISMFLLFGTMANGLIVCMIFSFIVDLYPTSYRGMATCLCTMVARAGALSGVNMIGAFVMSQCKATFIGCSILMLAGVMVTSLLPPYYKPINNSNNK